MTETMTMTAYCGLTCTECPAFKATLTNDHALAEATAQQWAKDYQVKVRVENVWCDGCLVEGKKCAHCGECEIRACGMKKGVENCGRCADYATCATIAGFLSMVPPAKANLERIRAGGQDA
jgi:hypothetical protein